MARNGARNGGIDPVTGCNFSGRAIDIAPERCGMPDAMAFASAVVFGVGLPALVKLARWLFGR